MLVNMDITEGDQPRMLIYRLHWKKLPMYLKKEIFPYILPNGGWYLPKEHQKTIISNSLRTFCERIKKYKDINFVQSLMKQDDIAGQQITSIVFMWINKEQK